jgi:hypothetical protein
MKKLALIFIMILLAGCATDQKKDRHVAYYESLHDIAKERAAERQAELQMKIGLIQALFGTQQSVPVKWNGTYQDSNLVKMMAVMMIFNDREDPRSLSYALQEVQSPLPTIGERITDGVFRTLPVALGIAGAAYGGYLIDKAGEYGATTAIANAPSAQGAPQTVNNTTTNEHYNVNSYNSQEARMEQGNAGGAGPGGSRNADSGNQGNVGVIGQSQDFSANNPAMRSGSYQAPYNIPVVIP